MCFRGKLTILLISFLVAGCGGRSSVIENPESLVLENPLALAADERLSTKLDWVVYRDGPGSWARDVNWDEYLIRVQNISEAPIRVTNVVVFDSTGTLIERNGNLRHLLNGSYQVQQRYKDDGITVYAGAGALEVAGVAVAGAAGIYLGSAAAGYFGGTAGAVMGVASAGLVLIPFAVGDVVGAVNEVEVNNRIIARQTLYPVLLQPAEEYHLVVFFPVAPSPRQIDVTYVDPNGVHTLTVDTSLALKGLHLE